MDKIKDPARIQEAMVADAILDYVRTNRLPQKDLDTYAGSRQFTMPVSEAE